MIYSILKKYIRTHITMLIAYAILFMIASSLALVIPLIQSNIIDEFILNTAFNAVLKVIILYILSSLASIILSYILEILLEKISLSMTKGINVDAISHLQKSNISKIEAYDLEYLNKRISEDSGSLVGIFLGNYISFFFSAFSLVVMFIILYRIHFMILLCVIIFIPIYLFVYRLFKKKLYNNQYKQMEENSLLYSMLSKQIQTIKKIKRSASYKNSKSILNDSYHKYIEVTMQTKKISSLYQKLDNILTLIVQLLIFSISAKLIGDSRMTVGSFILALNYFAIITSVITYFMSVGELFQKAKVSATRLAEVFDIPQELNGKMILANIERIEIDNLSFSYPDDDQTNPTVIRSFSQVFERGKIYTLTGENGVGKSTIIDVMLFIYQEYIEGNVYYNGVSIEEIDMYYLRKHNISVLSQDYSLPSEEVLKIFDSSIESVEFFLESLNSNFFQNESFSALEKMNCHGAQLSGGEQQKLAILLSIINDTDVLILDEPTSALDIDSTNEFSQLLSQLKNDKIIILVSHDPVVQQIADVNIKLTKESRGN